MGVKYVTVYCQGLVRRQYVVWVDGTVLLAHTLYPIDEQLRESGSIIDSTYDMQIDPAECFVGNFRLLLMIRKIQKQQWRRKMRRKVNVI